jgi:hypothetical protein
MFWKKAALAAAAAAAAFALTGWSYYLWMFPYGYDHCCDICLYFALETYADEHGGFFPGAQSTSEASLCLLYPKYADAELLRGKAVSVQKAQALLAQGKVLDADTCGWQYVEGLTKSDDRELAIFWDKIGLGHHGERLPSGGHSVVFLDGNRKVVPAKDWPQFLEQQNKLLASRNESAIKGLPMLTAKLRLPSGEVLDHFSGPWRLVKHSTSADGRSSGIQESSVLVLLDSQLRWYRSSVPHETITYVLCLTEKKLHSKPIKIEVRNGRWSPSSIIFEMEADK